MSALAYAPRVVALAAALALTVSMVPAPATPAPGPGPGPVKGAIASAGPGEATLRTDDHGVTHIYADDPFDLFYANGYVQARDRLFQLDVLRHVAKGDSAEILGPAQLDSDMTVRRDLYTQEERLEMFEEAPEDLKLSFRAYADGVNRFIAEAAARDALPAEFAALGHAPEPWTPLDTVATATFLIGFFGVSGGQEIDNARRLAALEGALGSEAAAHQALGDLTWLNVTDSYTTIPGEERTVDGGEEAPAHGDVPSAQLELAKAADGAQAWSRPADAGTTGPSTWAEVDASLGGHEAQAAAGLEPGGSGDADVRTHGTVSGLLEGAGFGSNALLVSDDKTAGDGPIVLGGPQTSYFKPPVFYEVGLHGAGYDVSGVGVATAPGVVIGQTPDLAWSVTSGIDDHIDTVALELDPDDRHRYKWDGEWHRMDCRQEIHRVRPPASLIAYDPDDPTAVARVVVQEVCEAQGMTVVGWNPDADVAWAQQVTSAGDEIESSARWLRLGAVDDLDGFKEELRGFNFTFNFNVASGDGIAYLHTGKVPERADGLDHRLPRLPGSSYAWQGTLNGGDLEARGLWITEPQQGYTVQWNNAPAEGWRAGDSPRLWGSLHRAELLDKYVQEELDGDGALNWSDVARTNELAATHDPFARATVPHLVQAAENATDPQVQAMGDALAAWAADDYAWADDGDGNYSHEGHAVWDATRKALQEEVFADELGPVTPQLVFEPGDSSDPHAADHGRHNNKDVVLVDALEDRTAHDWCDDVEDAGDQTCRDALLAALQAAAGILEDRFGSADVDDWHLAVHENVYVPLGAQGEETHPMVNRGSWNQVVRVGPGVGLDESRAVLPPGNVGTLTAADLLTGSEPDAMTSQLGLYEAFDYKPFPVEDGDVDQVAQETRTLQVPPGGG